MAATETAETDEQDKTAAEYPAGEEAEALDQGVVARRVDTFDGRAFVVDSSQEVVTEMGAEFRTPPRFTVRLTGRREGQGETAHLTGEQMDRLQVVLRTELKSHGMEPSED